MNKYLEQLVELSKIDSSIGEFEPKIAKENEKLSVFMEDVNRLQNRIDTLNEHIKDLQDKKIKNESHLKDKKVQLDSIAKKLKDITNDKELKSLQIEESLAKENIDSTNEEIERLDTILKSKKEDIESASSELEEESQSVKEMEAVINQAIEELYKQRDLLSENRAKLVVDIDNKILAFYEKIRRWAKNTAVVPVKKQACYGCYLKINDKTYSEVVKSEEIVTCHHCGRILYFEPQVEEE